MPSGPSHEACGPVRSRVPVRRGSFRPRPDRASHFDVSQQAASQHLQVLKDAGLVAVRPVGQRRLYAIRPEGLESVREFLAELWPRRLEDLKRAVEDSSESR
jgi:DNA-binding transcriptional ArsR family regulator